jgi:hypothetical protein
MFKWLKIPISKLKPRRQSLIHVTIYLPGTKAILLPLLRQCCGKFALGKNCKASKIQSLPGNGSRNTPSARQQWSNRGTVFSTRSMRWLCDATIEELFEEMPRLYKKEQLRLRKNLKTAVRRVGGWYEMDTNLGISGVDSDWVESSTVWSQLGQLRSCSERGGDPWKRKLRGIRRWNRYQTTTG